MISVIVPIGPKESGHQKIVDWFCRARPGRELILVYAEGAKNILPEKEDAAIRAVMAPAGRAHQLNAGARVATGRFLWFLHADSEVVEGGAQALKRRLEADESGLYYFDLQFRELRHLMFLNEMGVWARSHVLKMPFGDQALCVSAQNFSLVGGFDEEVRYGEDHVFVWRARQHGMRVLWAGSKVITSARRYQEHGWLQTTLRHLYLTFRQAGPELWAYLTGKR